jgi:hypothetical protein
MTKFVPAARDSFVDHINGGASATATPGRGSCLSRATFFPRAVAKHKLKSKGRPLPPQLYCAHHDPIAELCLSFISSFRFADDCRRMALRAVADKLMGECEL